MDLDESLISKHERSKSELNQDFTLNDILSKPPSPYFIHKSQDMTGFR